MVAVRRGSGDGNCYIIAWLSVWLNILIAVLAVVTRQSRLPERVRPSCIGCATLKRVI